MQKNNGAPHEAITPTPRYRYPRTQGAYTSGVIANRDEEGIVNSGPGSKRNSINRGLAEDIIVREDAARKSAHGGSVTHTKPITKGVSEGVPYSLLETLKCRLTKEPH